MNINGTNSSDKLVGTVGDDVISGGGGNDTLDGVAGNDELYGDDGDDLYIIRSRFDSVYDTSGYDRGTIYVDFYKTNPTVEYWSWAAGVQRLPYWIDALLPGTAPGFVPLLGGSKTYYYCFPTSVPTHFSAEDASGFKAFTPQQQAFARQALAYISSVIDISFVETTEAAALNTIVFADNIQSGSAGYAYEPFDNYVGSNVLLNYGGNSVKNLTPQNGDYSALTLIHELGHALGLKHPFSAVDASGGTNERPFLPFAEDTSQWSVMSYNDRVTEYFLRYSPLDIAALQYLYGPSKQVQTNDVYTLSAGSANIIWDGGGTDTIDGSALSQSVTLYLEPGYWGYIGSKSYLISSPGQITVNFGTVIENAKGGSANDYIVGNGAANRIYGLAGNDTLDGGAGDDMLDGGAGNDTFIGLSGHDLVLGGTGSDRLQLAQGSSQMQLLKLRNDTCIVTDASGVNMAICRNVEQILFSDKLVNLADVGITGNVNPVLTQIYVAAFRRAPEMGGYDYWAKEVATRGIDAVADTIFSLDVVKAIYPTDLAPAQFVTTIYNNVFNRAPEAEGLDYWTKQLSTKSRGQFVIDITSAALGVPDGTDGKDFFQNRVDWALYAVDYQREQNREMTPAHLSTLTDGVNADTGTLVALIGQAETGIVI